MRITKISTNLSGPAPSRAFQLTISKARRPASSPKMAGDVPTVTSEEHNVPNMLPPIPESKKNTTDFKMPSYAGSSMKPIMSKATRLVQKELNPTVKNKGVTSLQSS